MSIMKMVYCERAFLTYLQNAAMSLLYIFVDQMAVKLGFIKFESPKRKQAV